MAQSRIVNDPVRNNVDFIPAKRNVTQSNIKLSSSKRLNPAKQPSSELLLFQKCFQEELTIRKFMIGLKLTIHPTSGVLVIPVTSVQH
jgi:hypothetical protein